MNSTCMKFIVHLKLNVHFYFDHQAMKGLLSGRQPTLHQVDASATALQASLTSPQLDKRLTALHDHWTAVNQKVSKTLFFSK